MWRVKTSRAVNRLLGGKRNELFCTRIYLNHWQKTEKLINFFFGSGHVRRAALWDLKHNRRLPK